MDIRRRMLFRKKASSSGGGSTTGGSYTVNLNGQWEKTTAISNPDSTLYDGVYRSSSNYNVNSGVATMYITIKDCSSFKMYIRSYAESNYDYVMVSQLDKTITGSTSYGNTTLVKAHTRGNQQSGTALSSYTLVEFTGISSGEHIITVVYRKDGSVNNGDDRGYVLIEKSQAGSGGSTPDNPGTGGDTTGAINTDNYLTILALENGLTASLSKNACQYCIDGDGNWIDLPAGTTTQSINSGQTLSFRGNLTPSSSNGIGTFTISKKCNLEGNCMSMLFGDNAVNNYSLSDKDYAFYELFYGCTSIIQVSETFLPATTLSNSCYQYMFYGCSSLTIAPELPATTLANRCYYHMFYSCSNLNYIKMLATDISATSCLDNWVSGVSSTGTFVKHPDMTTLPNGSSGIPLGWIGGNPTDPANCLTIYALEDGLQVKFNRNSSSKVTGYMYYSVDNGVTWTLLNSGEYTPEISAENSISFKGNMKSNYSEVGIGSFTITKKCTLNGILYSLTAGDNGANVTRCSWAFRDGLFKNNTTIISANNLKLPATSLNMHCYDSMFNGCTNLTSAPELPATTLANYCYDSMFNGCSSLTTAPELPATTLAKSCYNYMFDGCSSLTTAPELPATTLANYCYTAMFRNCTNLTTAPELPATTLADYCYDSMFNGCSSLTTAPELPATTLDSYCYRYMFVRCSKLNYIKMLATDISASDCLTNWVYNVSSAGKFVKHPIMASLPTGDDGIPSGWAVVNNGEENTTYSILLYTSSDGNIVEPYDPNIFGATIVSNTYNNGKGVITFDANVTTIGYRAFYGCTSLTSVTIGDSVTTIGNSAFDSCTSLTSVTIGDSVTTIGNSAFDSCSSLTSVTIPDSVTTIGNSAFLNCDSLTSIIIPDSVTTIGSSAFKGCSSLTSITIGDSVTSIGIYAFELCSNLTSITIPDSVTTIESGAFADCANLVEFNGKFASEDGRCLIVDGTLNSFAIGCGATEYTIPDSVTTIGNSAFDSCSSLTSVTIPNSVTTIGTEAFYECPNLTSVTIPDSVTFIDSRAFRYCNSLTSITIPDSVTGIGERSFSNCSSLTSVYCEATTPPSLGSNAFTSNASGRKIYVPTASVEAYKSAFNWIGYSSKIVGYDFEDDGGGGLT